MSCENEVDIDNKLNNHLTKTYIINSTFRRQKTLNKTRIKLSNTPAVPGLLSGSENWTIKRKKYKKNNSGRDEMFEKYSRIHLDRS